MKLKNKFLSLVGAASLALGPIGANQLNCFAMSPPMWPTRRDRMKVAFFGDRDAHPNHVVLRLQGCEDPETEKGWRAFLNGERDINVAALSDEHLELLCAAPERSDNFCANILCTTNRFVDRCCSDAKVVVIVLDLNENVLERFNFWKSIVRDSAQINCENRFVLVQIKDNDFYDANYSEKIEFIKNQLEQSGGEIYKFYEVRMTSGCFFVSELEQDIYLIKCRLDQEEDEREAREAAENEAREEAERESKCRI